jgi:tetratricopeptide (TPR) repeat protein
MRKILIAVTLLGAVGGMLALPPPCLSGGEEGIQPVSEMPRKGRLVLFRSQEFRNKGDYETSARILSDFLEDEPDHDHFWLRFYLAVSLSQSGRHEEAIEHYKRSVELEERFAQGWLNLGELAYNLGWYELAAEAITTGSGYVEKKEPHILYYAAAANLMSGNPSGAAELLEDLISGRYGRPKLDWYRGLVSASMELKDEEEGRRAIDSLLHT